MGRDDRGVALEAAKVEFASDSALRNFNGAKTVGMSIDATDTKRSGVNVEHACFLADSVSVPVSAQHGFGPERIEKTKQRGSGEKMGNEDDGRSCRSSRDIPLNPFELGHPARQFLF